MNDKRLQDLLSQLDEPLSGDNFVEPVMKRLPASNNQRWRALVFASAGTLAATVVLAVFPFQQLPLVAAQLATAPWLATATAAAASMLSWVMAKNIIED